MTLLLHLSDLHFGRTDAIALQALSACVCDLSPDGIVVTGDLTQSGRRAEFKAAAAFLEDLKTPIAVVPGNHDAPVYSLLERFVHPWRQFEKHFGSVAPRAWDIGDASIIGINSARRAAARLNWSFGKLALNDIERASAMARTRSEDRIVLLATHHPFRLGPGTAGSEKVGRADFALKKFAQCGVSIVLSGHVHDSSVEILEETDGKILSVASGSALSTRQRTETASFTSLSIEGGNQPTLLAVRYSLNKTVFEASAIASFVKEHGRWSAISKNEEVCP